MNKKTVLPINGKRGLYFQGQEAQRDADWERILPLISAAHALLAHADLVGDGYIIPCEDIFALEKIVETLIGIEVRYPPKLEVKE